MEVPLVGDPNMTETLAFEGKTWSTVLCLRPRQLPQKGFFYATEKLLMSGGGEPEAAGVSPTSSFSPGWDTTRGIA